MAKDPAFLFYPGDYLRDTQCLSESVQVAYDRIMCEHMRNICISKQQLNFFTKRLNSEQKEELLMVLDAVSGGYQISWVAESIEKRRKYSESRRNNRSGSGKKKKKICKTYDSHMENENEIVNEDQIGKEKTYETFFEEFWNIYPRRNGKKVGKKNAFRNFKKIGIPHLVHVIANAKNYGINNDYPKDAERFLKDDLWKEWDTPQTKGQTNEPKSFAQQQWDAYEESSKCPAPELDEMGNISYGNAKNGGGVPLIEGGDKQGTQ